jgi:hypothetical protein
MASPMGCLTDRVLSCVAHAADGRCGAQVQCQTLPKVDWNVLCHISCRALLGGARGHGPPGSEDENGDTNELARDRDSEEMSSGVACNALSCGMDDAFAIRRRLGSPGTSLNVMRRVCLVGSVVACTMRYLDNAEQIPIRILEYDEISMGFVPPRIACRAEVHQSFYFALLVRRIEIEVQPTPLANSSGGGLIQRDVLPVPLPQLVTEVVTAG